MVEAISSKSSKPARPITASGRMGHQGVEVSHNYMRDDITQNLPHSLQFVDEAATSQASASNSKYAVFKDWLIKNGAVFDESIEFPAVFAGGLEGLAAKKPIGPY